MGIDATHSMFFFPYVLACLLQMTMLAWGTLASMFFELSPWPFVYIPKESQTVNFILVNFSFPTYTPPSCTCALVVFHSISPIINHSYSSSCRWWCRKFIFFVWHTIIHMCHLISLIHIQHIPVTPSFMHTKLPAPNTWCVLGY